MKKRRQRGKSKSAARKARPPRESKRKKLNGDRAMPDRSAISARGVHLSIQQASEEFGHNWKTIQKRIRDLGIKADGDRQGYAVYRLRDLLAMERQQENGVIDPDRLTPFEQAAYYKAVNERLKAARDIETTCMREDVEAEMVRVWRLWTHALDILTDEIERDIGAPAAVLEALEAKLDALREGIYADIVDGKDPAAGEVAAAVPEPEGRIAGSGGDHPAAPEGSA